MKTATLTAERCDRCGAQACVRVQLSGGGELWFCREHARQHEQRLRAVAVAYEDTGADQPN